MKNNDEIELVEILNSIFKRKVTIIIFVVSFSILGYGYYYLSEPKWVSEIRISEPTLGQLSNYPQAVNLSNSNNIDASNNIITSVVFDNFLMNLNALILSDKYKDFVKIDKSKEFGYYTLSLFAPSATQAQSELLDLYEQANFQTKNYLYSSVESMLEARILELNENINILEMQAKKIKNMRMDLLRESLKISRKLHVKDNQIKVVPQVIPDETLFMLGEDVLSSLLSSSSYLYLDLDNKYYDYKEWYLKIIGFELDSVYFQSANVISKPSLPKFKSNPKVGVVLVISILLGLLLGCVYVLLTDMLNSNKKSL